MSPQRPPNQESLVAAPPARSARRYLVAALAITLAVTGGTVVASRAKSPTRTVVAEVAAAALPGSVQSGSVPAGSAESGSAQSDQAGDTDACSVTKRAVTLAAANHGRVSLADLAGADPVVKAAVLTWAPATIAVTRPGEHSSTTGTPSAGASAVDAAGSAVGAAGSAVDTSGTGSDQVAIDAAVADLTQNCPAATQLLSVGSSTPFFLKALAASAAQIATWLVIAAGCEAAFPAAAAVCKKVADFCGGFIGALVFQAFDGKINRAAVLNSFLNGLTTVALGTVVRRGNLVEELASQFRRAGAWLRDTFLSRLSSAVFGELELTITSL